MPAVPGMDSSTIAAIVPGPSRAMTCSRCASARSHSSASVVGVERAAVEERPEEVHRAGAAVVVGPAARVAGQVHREVGAAVVGAVRREHLEPAGVQPGHPDRVLDRVCAAVGEEHLVQAARGRRRRSAGPPRSGPRSRAVGAIGAERRRLLLDRRDHPRVLVADVGEDQLGGEVEVLGALVVPDRDPCAFVTTIGSIVRPGPTRSGRRASGPARRCATRRSWRTPSSVPRACCGLRKVHQPRRPAQPCSRR